ncbi:MAG: hypothetical protein AAF735_07195 [Myxococcota bacterium]
MTVTDEPFPRGPCFAVDLSDAAVWVGDTGVLRRVARGSCSQQDFALGPGVLPRSLALSGNGDLLMLLDIESSAIDHSSSPWLPPASNGSFRAVARFRDGDAQTVVQIPYGPSIADALVDTTQGEFLGPHSEGAAVYESDGVLREVFNAARTQHHPAQASMSEDGTQIALTHDEGAVRIIDRSNHKERVAATGFSQIHELEFHSTGALLIRGCHESEGWGLFREQSEALEHISKDVRASLAPDGKRVAELSRRLVIKNIAEDNVEFDLPLPALGMAKNGRAVFVGERSVIVQTDAHTLGEVEYRTE